jgi:hypothetical protein
MKLETRDKWTYVLSLVLAGVFVQNGCGQVNTGPDVQTNDGTVSPGLDGGLPRLDGQAHPLDYSLRDAANITDTGGGPDLDPTYDIDPPPGSGLSDGAPKIDSDTEPDGATNDDGVNPMDGGPDADGNPVADGEINDDGVNPMDGGPDADGNPVADGEINDDGVNPMDGGPDADVVQDAAAPANPDLALDAAPPVPDQAIDAGDPPPQFPELALGPYTSLMEILIRSIRSGAAAYDANENYAHVANQGYVLQAMGEILWHTRDYAFAARDEIVALALEEIEELRAASGRVVGGGPAYGLERVWDAFGDGSENPAFTAYTWQSGSVALGVAKVARYLNHIEHPQAVPSARFGSDLVSYWFPFYSQNDDGGYFWYSHRQSDAIAVHNTSALIAMAGQILGEIGQNNVGDRSRSCADLLWARLRGNPQIGYEWNYADDGFPIGRRRAEDVSHALITLQFMRMAGDRGWWPPNRMTGVSRTLLGNMWSGHPARLAGYVDGRANDAAWLWTRAAVVGYAAHGDAVGGDPAVFDYARSILFSSYMSRYDRPLVGASVSGVQALAIALLLTRRPAAFAEGSRWTQAAGPGDDARPDAPGGVRFYHVDWEAPAPTRAGRLTLEARLASDVNANILIDLEPNYDGRVIVSLTYRSAADGMVQEWDGDRYQDLAPLPATTDDEGVLRWMRTTFELNRAIRFDYQGPIPGTNVLLQITSRPAVHMIEATPLP